MGVAVTVVRGEVVSFDRTKGYGFVATGAGTDDVFLHINDLVDERTKGQLGPGTIVEFRMSEGDRGPKASAVTIVKPAPGSGAAAFSARIADPVSHPGYPGSNPNAEDMCDVLSVEEFEREFTELLLRADPPMTGAQILDVRQKLKVLAQNHGWVDV